MNRKERRAIAKKAKSEKRRSRKLGRGLATCSGSLTAQLIAMGPETHPESSLVTASMLYQQEHEALVKQDSSWNIRFQSFREDFLDDQIWVCTTCGAIAAFDDLEDEMGS